MSNNNKTEHDKINQPGKLDKIFFTLKNFMFLITFHHLWLSLKIIYGQQPNTLTKQANFLGVAQILLIKLKRQNLYMTPKIANQNKHLQIKKTGTILKLR